MTLAFVVFTAVVAFAVVWFVRKIWVELVELDKLRDSIRRQR